MTKYLIAAIFSVIAFFIWPMIAKKIAPSYATQTASLTFGVIVGMLAAVSLTE